MSRGDKWVPLDKYLAQDLKNINRPFSKIEAMFSHTLDIDNDVSWSIKGYAKLWQWSRCRVRKFLQEIKTHSGHISDTTRTLYRHPIHFIDKGLWSIKDTLPTHSRHINDTLPDPTSNPNPKPNKKNNKYNGSIESIFEYWKAIHKHPRSKLDAKRKKLIIARLKEGYTEKDLKRAIDGCKVSEYHQGKNDRNATYDNISLILRDADKVDAFIKHTENTGGMKGKWL